MQCFGAQTTGPSPSGGPVAENTCAYAGSRETPLEVEPIVRRTLVPVNDAGFTVNTGGADGFDTYAEAHAQRCRVYLPKPGHKGHRSPYCNPTPLAFQIAAEFHPRWKHLDEYERQLHARNSHIMLGLDCSTPVRFLVCWTQGARVVGGTGQALRIAKGYGIPVVNLWQVTPMFGDVAVLERIHELVTR